MNPKFNIVFDEVILGQLKKLGKNKELRERISKILDKIEELGPSAGKLLDSKLRIYEVKSKRPPIRLYYKHVLDSKEIYIFEYELKTSKTRQKKTIKKLKQRESES